MAEIVSAVGEDTAVLMARSFPGKLGDKPSPEEEASCFKAVRALNKDNADQCEKTLASFFSTANNSPSIVDDRQYNYVVRARLHRASGTYYEDDNRHFTILEALYLRYCDLVEEAGVETARELYLRLLIFILIDHAGGQLGVETISHISAYPIIKVDRETLDGITLNSLKQRGTLLHQAVSTSHLPIITLVRDVIISTEEAVIGPNTIEKVDLSTPEKPVVSVLPNIAARFLWLQVLYSRTVEDGLTVVFLAKTKDVLRGIFRQGDIERAKFLRYIDVDPVYNLYVTQRRERMLAGTLDRKLSMDEMREEGQNFDIKSGVLAVESFFRFVREKPLFEVPARTDGAVANEANKILRTLDGPLLVDAEDIIIDWKALKNKK